MTASEKVDARIKSDGILLCEAVSDELDKDSASQLWPNLYVNDVIVTLKYNQENANIAIIKYFVADKGLIHDFGDSHILSIQINRVEETTIKKISLQQAQDFNRMGKPIRKEDIDDLISEPNRINVQDFKIKKSNSFISSFKFLGLDCEVEKFRSEIKDVDKLVRSHEFGNTRNLVRVLARDQGNIFGVGLLDFDEERYRSNAAAESTSLYDYDMLRKNVIILRRMVIAQHPVYNKFHIQRALIRIGRNITRALTDKKIVMLAGNSYEYQPAVLKEGFVCEVPKNPRNSLFYWLPVSGFVDFDIDLKKTRKKIREYLERRVKLGLRKMDTE